MIAVVERLAADIVTHERFIDEIVRPCRPVVLRGLARDWPVVEAARDPARLAAYLAGFATRATSEVFVGDPQIGGRYYYGDDLAGFNFERRVMPFADAVASILTDNDPAVATMYVGSLPVEAYLPGFSAVNSPPVFATPKAGRIWLGHGSIVAAHYDTLDNLACVVAGNRRFTVFDPMLIGDLYVGPIDHTMAGQPVSLAASAAPGDTRYPRFAAIADRALVAELGPGDALYLPKLWWHQVEATAPVNALVNYWWDAFSAGPDAPYATLLLAMIAIAERPLSERGAWRALFDHYVFRPHGHPLAHLPAERHGLLGPLHPYNYGRIRARVMQMLRG